MSTNVCELVDGHGEPLRWGFTAPLGTCLYNGWDQTSFVVGWLSVFCWTFALLPQIITNFLNKSAESQSFWFWMLWLAGDCCNLSGCLLTHNLITNIALAAVYLFFTAIACLQFIWYEYLVAHRYKNLETNKNLEINRNLLMDPKASPKIGNTITSPLLADQGTVNLLIDHFQNEITPTLLHAVQIARVSPRMFNVNMTLSPMSRRELRRIRHHHNRLTKSAQYGSTEAVNAADMSPIQPLHGSARMSMNTWQRVTSDPVTSSTIHVKTSQTPEPKSIGLPVNTLGERAATMGTTFHQRDAMAPHSAGPYTPAHEESESTNLDSLQLPSPVLPPNQTMAHHDEIVLFNPQSTSPQPTTSKVTQSDETETSNVSTALKAAALTGTGLMSVAGWVSSMKDEPSANPNHSRMLLSQSSMAVDLLVAGCVLGWASSVIYISSRIPQLRLMVRTKIVTGLNPFFFVLTFGGNMFQCLSMCVNKYIWHSESKVASMMPWLISSSVCMFQDAWILYLIWTYRRNDTKLKNVTINTAPTEKTALNSASVTFGSIGTNSTTSSSDDNKSKAPFW